MSRETERGIHNRETAVALYSGGATMQEVGTLLGVSRERVRQYLDKAGQASRRSGALIDPARILTVLRKSGATSVNRVARAAGLPAVTVRTALLELGMMGVAERLFRARRRVALLRELRALAALHGRTLGAKDLQRAGCFTRCRSHYGTHAAALRAAGLPAATAGQYVKYCEANGRSA